MRRVRLPRTAAVLLDVAVWALVHAGSGYAAHRLDARRLERDGPLLRARRFEAGGRVYRRRLRIDRWKDRMPEAGDWFSGGVSKRRLPSRDDAGLELFARETRRAELAHWWALGCVPLFALWNPPRAVRLLTAYGVASNVPFIVIQRYNRFRIQVVRERMAARRERQQHRPSGERRGPQ